MPDITREEFHRLIERYTVRTRHVTHIRAAYEHYENTYLDGLSDSRLIYWAGESVVLAVDSILSRKNVSFIAPSTLGGAIIAELAARLKRLSAVNHSGQTVANSFDMIPSIAP